MTLTNGADECSLSYIMNRWLHRRGRFGLHLTVTNVFDTVALYNFLSTFSGTHFLSPRVVQVRVVMPF